MAPPNDPQLTLVLLILQGVWGLFLLTLTFAMRRVLKDIENNTQATNGVAVQLNNMNVLLTGNYILKSEHDRLEERVRKSEGLITELRTRDDYREALMKTNRRGG